MYPSSGKRFLWDAVDWIRLCILNQGSLHPQVMNGSKEEPKKNLVKLANWKNDGLCDNVI